jgi:hypothetical protein
VEPENLTFGGGVSATIFNPWVLIVVVIAGLLLWFCPRNKAIFVFLTASILIPTDQVLVAGSLHFPVLRILILFGLARMVWATVFSNSKIFSCGMNGIDIALILLTTFTVVDGILLWKQWGEVVFQLGNLYTAFGLYFLLRFLIRSEEDVRLTIRVFAYLAAVVAVFMMYEHTTGRNPIYAMLGGGKAVIYGSATERNDQFRATASFAHPILAGTFGAILLPLFVGLWWKYKENRKIALVGIISATVIPIAANSSTSLLGYIAGVAALCFWPFRKRMRPIRWGIVLTLVFLHLVMKSPVWSLISRIDLAGGSSSYHRYELVNQSIIHFWDWLLVGTKDYPNWGWDMWDLSNQYVSIGDLSGLIPLISFLGIIVLGFKYLGRARKASEGEKQQELFIWAIGAALFANVVAFFGITYFDQTIVAWYALLAIIGVMKGSSPAISLEEAVVRPYPANLAAARVPGHAPKIGSGFDSNGKVASGRWSTR